MALAATALLASPAHAQNLGMTATQSSAPRWSSADTARPAGGPFSVTHDTTRDDHVLVWGEHRAGAYRTYAVRTGPGGAATTDPVELASNFYGGHVAYAPASDQLLVVLRTPESGLVARRYTAGLAPVGAAIPIATPSSEVGIQGGTVAHDADTGGWLVGWQVTRSGTNAVDEFRVQAIGDDGAAGPVKVVEQAPYLGTLRLAASDGGDVVAGWSSSPTGFSAEMRARLQALDDDGDPTGSEVTAASPDATEPVTGHVDLAWDGERWIAAYLNGSDFDWNSVFVQRFTAGLAAIGTPVAVHPTWPASSWSPPDIAVLPESDEALVAWGTSRYGGADLAGRAIDTATGTPLDTGPSYLPEPRATWDSDLEVQGYAVTAAPGTGVTTVQWLAGVPVTSPPSSPAPSPGWPGLGLYGRSFGVDRAPQTSITGKPAEGNRQRTGQVSFAATPSAGATFECLALAANGVDPVWQSCTSPATVQQYSEADHYFSVRASAGGWTDTVPATATWRTGDFNAPEAFFNYRVPKLTTARIARFGFDAYDDDPVTFRCSLDGGASFDCSGDADHDGELELTGLSLGNHVLRVWARDPLGNEQPTPTQWTWTVFSIDEPARSGLSDASSVSVQAPQQPAATPPSIGQRPPWAARTTKRAACKPRSRLRRCVAARRLSAAKARARARARKHVQTNVARRR